MADNSNYKGVFQNTNDEQRKSVQDSFNNENQTSTWEKIKSAFGGPTASPSPEDKMKAMQRKVGQ